MQCPTQYHPTLFAFSCTRLERLDSFTILQLLVSNSKQQPQQPNTTTTTTIMATDHRSSTFPNFPLLPLELREMTFEQALLPLIEPRIISVEKVLDETTSFWPFDFTVTNASFLHENDSFVTSADTLWNVCKDSRRVVRLFFRRFGHPGPQPTCYWDCLKALSLGAPPRPQGPHADIFFFFWRGIWSDSILMQTMEDPDWDYLDTSMDMAKRWLVPIHQLMADLDRLQVLKDTDQVQGMLLPLRPALIDSPTDIIALICDPNNGLASFKYSDLVIVSADASREMVIPGLEPENHLGTVQY